MTAPTSSSDRLAARGVVIPLADGSTTRLRYGFRALKELEDRFGSVVGLQTAMQGIMEAMDEGGGGAKAFGPILDLIVPGLLHNRGVTEDEWLDLLDPAHLAEYVDALKAAMEQAFPASAAGLGNVPGPTPGPGPGLSGTTSPPAATDALTASSGA